MRKKRNQPEIAPPHLEPKRITPVDIQQKEFRLAMRGYNERDVDQFLDEVTEEVARLYADNKRLREEVEFSRTTRLETSGASEGEAIIRQATEEAARIIAEARARASTMEPAPAGQAPDAATQGTGAPPTEIMGIFLARERAFLQNMANLIQAHAEGVKQDVRKVREKVRPAAEEAPVVEEPPPTPASSEVQAAPRPAEPGGVEPGREAGVAGGDRDTTDEPTSAWPAPPVESRKGSSGHDVVDLTHERPPETGPALSSVSGRTPAQVEGDLPRGPGPSRAGATHSPRVEEDDAPEDRSIRELFWGED